MVEESLTSELGREVIIGKAKINLWAGIGIAFEDFRVKDRSLAFDLLQSKRLILKLKIFPLLKEEIKWRRVILERTTLHLLRDKDGRFNIFDGTLTAERLKTSQQKMIQTLSTLFGGSPHPPGWRDLFFRRKPWPHASDYRNTVFQSSPLKGLS